MDRPTPSGQSPRDPRRRTRRAPRPDERRRDPERSRQLIIDAARTEFAAKGFAGARVGNIAERAGVNKQLISYYFGGKERLYDEIVRQWHELEAHQRTSATTLEELVVAYLRANHEQPELVRMLMWEGLGQDAPPSDTTPDDTARSLTTELVELQRRQSEGELDADLDPAYVLIAMMGAVSAGATMPHVVHQLCGTSPDSEEFLSSYSEQLRRIVKRLAAPR
jgi:AcrR family transcriptional regulator